MRDATFTTGAAAADERILGVRFHSGSLADAYERARQGGLLTAPSAPGMGYTLVQDPVYRRALETSDVVLTDSSFMVLLWRLRTGRRLPRHSGLAFLRYWLERSIDTMATATLWVMPSAKDRDRARAWLQAQGHPVEPDDFYVAPMYPATGEIRDARLAALIEARRPRTVYLGIAGGVQERLGLHLRDQLSYRPTLLCLGAALAFLTGAQVSISPRIDRWRLGWLWRLGANPAGFAARLVRATGLAWLILRYGAQPPPLRAKPDIA